MIIRMLVESLRTVGLVSRRERLLDRALSTGFVVLRPIDNPVTFPDVQKYQANGPSGGYVIFVTPPVAGPPAQGYPVLYLLDGNAWVAGAAEAMRLQSRFWRQSRIEPMIIVAVGYPGDMPFDLGRRAYDYLPPHSSRKLSERFMQGMPWHQPGGADQFLSWLTGPLRDDLTRRYPVNPQRQFLCGHSFGGFFVLSSLLRKPDAFAKYVALSPSIWWDDGRLLRDADALIAALPSNLATQLLIGVGEDEAPDRPHISARMRNDAEEMTRRLRENGPAQLSVVHRVFEGENHQSVPLAAFSAALRFVSDEAPGNNKAASP